MSQKTNLFDIPHLIISSAMENLKTQNAKTEMLTIWRNVSSDNIVSGEMKRLSEWVSEWWPLFSGKGPFLGH